MKKEWIVFPGGLMRCCLATLTDAAETATKDPEEGDLLPCKTCGSEMIFKDAGWRWNQPEQGD